MTLRQNLSRFLGIAIISSTILSTSSLAETVLITGANQGIGLEFARQYAEQGFTVYATHRRDGTPDSLIALEKEYPNVHAERMDVTRHDEIEALAKKLEDQPIDILINNAAIKRTAPITDQEGNANQLFGSLDYELFNTFVSTNITGPLKITEEFIEHIRASKLKKIVTISSAAGTVSILPNAANNYWYRISKAALNSSMRLLTVELKPDDIIVVMFHPGGVLTDGFKGLGLRGLISPEEAIDKMITTIDGLTMEDSGRFLQNDGRDQAW